MATDKTDIESNYKKLVCSLYQYLNKEVKDFGSLKPEICNTLKTHRPIKKFDYEYGISKSLKGKSLLIVREFNDRSMVREYFKFGNNVWHCCECNRRATASESNESIIDLLIQHGIVFVKSEHDCKPRKYEFVKQIQKLYKEKKIDEADSLQKSVLGSEDSITPLNQSDKRKKESRSSKHAEIDLEIANIINLRYAHQKDDVAEEEQSVDRDQHFVKLSPEAAFAKIIENLKEYTNEEYEVILSNKSKILSALQTRRPIKICNYQYGLTQNLRTNRILIVFEWGDRKRVRQYSKRKDRSLWVCSECERLYRHIRLRTSYTYLSLINGIAFVEINHHSDCKPRDYELVMQYQKFLEEGDTAKAIRMASTIDFRYGYTSFANIKNALDATTLGLFKEDKDNENNYKTLEGVKRKMISDEDNGNNILDKELPVRKKSKLNKSALDDTVMNEDNSEEQEPPVLKKLKKEKSMKMYVTEEADLLIHQKSETHFEVEEENPTTSTFAFENPSVSKLKEICAKLNIQYCNKAVRFWKNVTFNKIDTAFAPTLIQRHRFQTQHFYEILSKLFTGTLKYHEEIKIAITDAFREDSVSSGEISTKKLNKLYLDTVTEEHLSFISKLLSCRIWIFDGEKGIRKYGKWKRPESKRLTLVLYFVDGFYSVVFSF